MNAEAELKIIKERINILIDQPFYGTLMLGMKLVENSNIPTACTDGKTIEYNPDFILRLSRGLVKSCLLHELHHVLYKHHLRLGARNFKRFNRAGDYAINQELRKNNFEVGKDWLIDSKYDGLFAEQIYDMLKDQPEDKDGGDDQPGDFKSPTNGDGSPMSASDIREAEVDLNAKILQAASVAKKAGKLPNGMEVLIKGITNPVAPWQSILAEFVDSHAKNDYSYRKLSRTAMQRGFVSPGLHSDELGSILIVIDTSGSTGWGNTRQRFLSEVFGIIDKYDCDLTIACADSQFYLTGRWDRGDFPEPSELRFQGNGGTELTGLIDFVAEQGIDPVCCIYLSDGDVYDWGEEPSFPVMMAVVGEAGRTPSWIRKIQI